MSRRTHTKSRNGCAECKKRHVKCDEILPTCTLCKLTDRVCSLSDKSLGSSSALENPSSGSFLRSNLTLREHNERVQDEQQYAINYEHLDLLSHFYTVVSKDCCPDPDSLSATLEIYKQSVSSARYILPQMLAISALHMGVFNPELDAHYRAYASEFQTQALSIFNREVVGVNSTNCMPALMFSSLIGIQALCETLRYCPDGETEFLDHFTNFVTLRRGAWIVAHASWDTLGQADTITPFLKSFRRTAEDTVGPGSECALLERMVLETGLDQSSTEACRLAITQLQWTFDVNRRARAVTESRRVMLDWAILVPADYVNLVAQRRPEAMVILAYYGALLLRYEDFWVVGSGGRLVIENITNSLDVHWKPWLAWPELELSRMAVLEGGKIAPVR